MLNVLVLQQGLDVRQMLAHTDGEGLQVGHALRQGPLLALDGADGLVHAVDARVDLHSAHRELSQRRLMKLRHVHGAHGLQEARAVAYDDAGVVGLAAALVSHNAESLLDDVGRRVLAPFVQLHLLHECVHVSATPTRFVMSEKNHHSAAVELFCRLSSSTCCMKVCSA